MATDNAERQCARCQRASRNKFIAPPEVSADFWDTEQCCEAFAAQHIGRVGRAYRMNPYHRAVYGPGGISQGLLGQWLGLKQPQISRIETGPPILNLDTLRYWARVLRIPPELLWFDLSDQDVPDRRHPADANGWVKSGSALSTGQAGSARLVTSLPFFLGSNLGPLRQLAGEDGEDMMKRRAFLQAATLTGLGVGGTASTLGLEVVRRELNHVMIDERVTADVDDWQEIALDYGQAYLATEPAALLQALIADLHGLQLTIQRHPDETAQRQLLQVGALLAAFTAQTVANLGNLFAARRWWRTARHAADEAGDPYTMFWIRGREVVRAGYEHRPVRVILQLVREAETRLDEAPPEALPELFSGKAQTLALAGRYVEAEQALCQVRECFGKLPTPLSHTDSISAFDWGEERLRFAESFVYSHLGDFAKAEQAQQAALRLYPDSDMRSPAQIELQRALCLVRSGDFTQGTRHAQTTITNLPVMHRIRPVADLGQRVLDVIPARERQQGWAQEYRECLESSFPGQANQFTNQYHKDIIS
ncbi:MAG: helix-turn-helix domain-containing protein [Pseudonocardiaceae bacterium]